MNFDQWSAVSSTPACKPTERALDLIDDDTDATEIRFDLLLRQDKVLRAIGPTIGGIGLADFRRLLRRRLRRRGWNGVCFVTVTGLVSLM